MDFKGKHVVITGGAGDIGFEITKQLLMQGAEVYIIYITITYYFTHRINN